MFSFGTGMEVEEVEIIEMGEIGNGLHAKFNCVILIKKSPYNSILLH